MARLPKYLDKFLSGNEDFSIRSDWGKLFPTKDLFHTALIRAAQYFNPCFNRSHYRIRLHTGSKPTLDEVSILVLMDLDREFVITCVWGKRVVVSILVLVDLDREYEKIIITSSLPPFKTSPHISSRRACYIGYDLSFNRFTREC